VNLLNLIPMTKSRGLEINQSILITAAPTRVLAAFFDPDALSTWWKTARSVTTPRPLGVYAVEWETTPFQDDLLGSLGGVFYGTVMDFRYGREFFVADSYWLPPESEPIGPMALEVRCSVSGPATRLDLRQSGTDTGKRWKRHHELWASGWKDSLSALKRYLEQGAEPHLPDRGTVPYS